MFVYRGGCLDSINQKEGINMNRAEAELAVRKYGGIRQACRVLHCSDHTIRDALRLPVTGKKLDVPRMKKSISEQDLLASTDYETQAVNAIRSGLRRIGKGQYVRDTDFRHECLVTDTNLWREVRTREEFWKNVIVVGNHSTPMIYWGNSVGICSLITRNKARRPVWVREDQI